MSRVDVPAVRAGLRRAYGAVGRLDADDPVSELVATILSQNTTDTNSGRAYDNLRRAFPTWDSVLDARTAEVERPIRCGGLGRIKAARIQRVLATVREREGRLDLRRLRRISNREALDYLMSMPGVGIKTACCVLLFSLRRPVMPVDTHIFRVAGRLGWLKPTTRIEDATAVLEALIPPRWILEMHINLIQHGRSVCHPRKPECHRCVIAAHCRARRLGLVTPPLPHVKSV